MGTNYYLRQKVKDKESLYNAIEKDNLPEIERLTECVRSIHIGKMSCGWKFLWDANFFNYFEPNKESIYNWLKSGIIYNEYEEKYTFEEFINELAEHHANSINSWDATSYSDYCADEGKYSGYYPRDTRFFDWFERRFKIKPDIYGEFYIDDLRFTIDSNFS